MSFNLNELHAKYRFACLSAEDMEQSKGGVWKGIHCHLYSLYSFVYNVSLPFITYIYK